VRGTVETRGRSYRVRVELGRDDEGKRRYLSKTLPAGTTKKEAETELTRMLGDVGILEGSASKRTLDELVDTYLRRPMSETYRYDLRTVWRLVPDSWKRERVGLLRTRDFDRLYDELAADGVSAWRVRRVHELLRSAMNVAVRYEWVATNRVALASPPRPRRKTPVPPSFEQIEKLLAAAGSELRLWLRLASTTGARRGEIAGLRWGDVDFRSGTLTISRAVSYAPGSGLTVKGTKTDRTRRLAIGPRMLSELDDARREQRDRSRRLGDDWDPSRYVIAADPEGRLPWRPDRATHCVTALRDELGLPGVRLKELRHYVATRLISEGEDVVTVAGRLGHASPSMTTDVYAAWIEARDRGAAELLD
jgi:integrase